MKKALNSRLRSEMVDPEVCQGFTTDRVKSALRNINLTIASGLDKIHPWFLYILYPVSVSLLMGIFNKSLAVTKVPQEWRVADIRPIPKGEKDLLKMESYGPISHMSEERKTMERMVANRLRYFAE